MKATIKGRSLASFAKALREVKRGSAEKIATEAAPALTALAQSDFAGRHNPYGDAWGGDYDLVETGALKSDVKFVAQGDRVRCVLGPSYAKYHVSKILPRSGGILPKSYQDALEDASKAVIGEALKF